MFSAFAPTTDVAGSDRTVTMCPQADLGPSIRSKSSPAPDNFFCKNTLHRNATPVLGQTVFGQVFGRGGMSNFQNPTVPPTGGSRLPRAHPSSFEMRRTGVGRQSNRARSPGTCRVRARCIGRCAGCSCGRDSAARLGYRARRWQVYSRTHAAIAVRMGAASDGCQLIQSTEPRFASSRLNNAMAIASADCNLLRHVRKARRRRLSFAFSDQS